MTANDKQMTFQVTNDTRSAREGWNALPNRDPNGLIYPLFQRNPGIYSSQIQLEPARLIQSNWQNLPARIDQLVEARNAAGQAFFVSTKDVIGCEIGALTSGDGKSLGQVLTSGHRIYLDRMGDGAALVLPILSTMHGVRDHIFLIEEPENGLHPAALKILLNYIEQAASQNQFFITTHSNIVLRQLGALAGTSILRVESIPSESIPTSNVVVVSNEIESRLAILRDLGHELDDYELYSAWLLLEESSAERIIRQYFLKWFAPSLVGRLRTVAGHGQHDVPPRFDAFEKIFLFAHLEAQYRGRAWVLVDGGPEGEEIISQMQSDYASNWGADHFRCLSQTDFEEYYPEEMSAEVRRVLGLSHKEKYTAKRQLLSDLIDWIEVDEERAKTHFASSTAEIVSLLVEIESAIAIQGN